MTQLRQQAREPKNPARVDAALRMHLRRMDREVRSCFVFAAVVGAVVVTLLIAQPLRPKQTSVLAGIGLVVTALAVTAGLSARGRREATRGKLLRTCRTCGYDLRATADACPECATPIPDELRRARDAGKDRQYLGVNPPPV